MVPEPQCPDRLDEARARMVAQDLRHRSIADRRVLEVMGRIPRHEFVPPEYASEAYANWPLPIGEGQTISQPYIVALMSEALELTGREKVLELGTGSGYQTAILAELAGEVWSIERSPILSQAAQDRLRSLGYGDVHCVVGDGTAGLPKEAPFDCILATGSLPAVPEPLLGQLSPQGRFVGPVGRMTEQRLVCIAYHPPRFVRRILGACRFVPLVGADGWPE